MRRKDVAAELADTFIYLLLLADELDVDLVAEYIKKTEYNETRFA